MSFIVKLPFGKRTNTEWCYILGDFGVKVEGAQSTIIQDRDKIGFSTLTAQGMPFYGGNIVYETEIDVCECYAVVKANFYRGALIKVFVDGFFKGYIAFSPYSPYSLNIGKLSCGKHKIEFELFGTRINTFGGMHNVVRPKWVGADYWRSTGDEWCYEYNLKDIGILSNPIIEIYSR